MINVNDLYIYLRDLMRKDSIGWTSSDEYNRLLVLAQNDLFEFYLEQVQSNHRMTTGLRVFVKEQTIAGVAGYYDLPADFRYKLEVGIRTIENAENCDDSPIVNFYPADQANSDKLLLLGESTIRKPSIANNRYYYEFIGGKIKVTPVTTAKLYLKYYRQPAVATRAYTLNTTTFEEVYNSGTSIQLEWPAEEFNSFVEILLFYKGIQMRDAELVQWLNAKRTAIIPSSVNNSMQQ